MMKLVVLSCLLAAASAGVLTGIAPYTPIAYTASYYAPYNYRGPLSLAPGQPANILGSDGRPLDTLEVNLDRSAHLAAKTFGGVHLLKKRSAPLIAPLSNIAVAHTPLVAPAHLTYSAPIATPFASHYSALPLAYGAAPLIHY
jgi:hypothetical protein